MEERQLNRLLWALVTLLVIALAALYLLRQAGSDRPIDPAVAQLSPCDLAAGPCQVTLPSGGAVTLTITPRPIAVITPLQVDLAHPGTTIDSAMITFFGIDMDMGINRFPLNADQSGSAHRGEAMLPVCVQGRMPWRAKLIMDIAGKSHTVLFEFRSVKP